MPQLLNFYRTAANKKDPVTGSCHAAILFLLYYYFLQQFFMLRKADDISAGY